MSIPTRSEAQTEADTAHQAVVDAANAAFIAEVGVLMAEAIAQGKYTLHLNTPKDSDPVYLQSYFFNLGYIIGFPDAKTINGQPAQLFGEFFEEYWNNGGIPRLMSPTRVVISWKTPNLPFNYY